VLREGLALLRKNGLIAVVPRQGYRSTSPSRRGRSPPAEINVLSPASASNLRLFTNLWLDELRQQLHDEGYRLVLHDGSRYFVPRPGDALRQLIRRHPCACWVLVHSSRNIQQWFVEHQIPAMAAGSVHPGVTLPSVRIDVEAVSRHAAGTLLRLGHRRLAFLNLRTDRAGDHESERAFLRVAGDAGAVAEIIHHDSRAESVEHAVRRLAGREPRVTGWLVGHSETYLSVLSALARLKLRVPEDISLISREDDPFLAALLPAPARYVAIPRHYSRRIHRLLLAIRAGHAMPDGGQPIVPEFIRGKSIDSPAH
jgi:LacI family transcriptional regulator